MTGPEHSDPLLETLRLAQRLGFFGSAPIETAAARAAAFVDAIGEADDGTRIADIGSGGGLPGLVIASALPHAMVTLIDRRSKRTDFLERAVRRLDLTNTAVWCGDVTNIVRSVRDARLPAFDVVTARGFGPPDLTLTLAVGLLAPQGCVVISEPPDEERWDPALLESLRLRSTRHGGVRRFDRVPGL